jgi:hypothetical protein
MRGRGVRKMAAVAVAAAAVVVALAPSHVGADDSFYPDGQDYPGGYPNPPDIDPNPEMPMPPYATFDENGETVFVDGVVDNPG